MDKKQKEKEKRETPIVDGDTRPDMPINPDQKTDKNEKQRFPTAFICDLAEANLRTSQSHVLKLLPAKAGINFLFLE